MDHIILVIYCYVIFESFSACFQSGFTHHNTIFVCNMLIDKFVSLAYFNLALLRNQLEMLLSKKRMVYLHLTRVYHLFFDFQIVVVLFVQEHISRHSFLFPL
ncbi:hypothetical protein GDO86_015309 [Hymenochirus boettgeri]|uniref:Uncharacterized protein n=1 Tax=Hymenochirus boettgeri TaxID=247094 RepID=A0A8T2JY93_9PIPI|nr:hypothetical protein GDO86_015309 [Hymenochirus boettgeri]